jgi:hypothetical protein
MITIFVVRGMHFLAYSPFNSIINLNVFVIHEHIGTRCSIRVKKSSLSLRHCIQTVFLYIAYLKKGYNSRE